MILPMIGAAALAGAAFVTLRRLASSTRWTDRHTVAVIAGALVAHSVGGLVSVADTTVDRVGLVGIIVVTIAALWWLDRRLQRRPGNLSGRAGDAPRPQP